MPKKTILLLSVLTILCLCAILPLSADAADQVLAYATGGYTDIRADVFAPDVGGSAVRMFDISMSDWDVSGDRQRKRHREVDGRICMMCELPDPRKDDSEFVGYTAFSLTLDEYAGAHNTLVFGVLVEGDGTANVPVRIDVSSMGEEITSQVYVTPDEWNLVIMDARTLESRITEMKITASYGTQIPGFVSVTKPYLTKNRPAGLRYAEKFSSNRWSAEEGNAQIKTGWISPDENGRAQITAPLISDIRQVPGAAVYFEISMEGVLSGNMTLGVLYEGAGEEQREYQKKISLGNSDGVYTVPVQADAPIVSYALRFENMNCADSGFNIRSVRLYGEGKGAIHGSSDIGWVESIVREGSGVVFSGVIEREAAVEYGDRELHFYAIPGWMADNLSYAVDLGSVEMTTRFQYTANPSSYGASSAADTFRFFVGIPTEEGILPLSHPRYPDAQPVDYTRVSNMGVYGGASVGVFESNASHVMVEIPLDRMILSSGGLTISYTLLGATADSGVFSNGGTRALHLNEEMLRQLDGEISFYLSAGIHVYLRLTAASPVKGLTYGGNTSENYGVRVTDNEARQMYAALIRTLSARWTGISGISLGRAVNYSALVGDNAMDNTASYAADLAEICRITYNAASVHVPDILVIVPYAEYRDGYDPDKWIADRTLAVMLADKLDEMGAIPWILMYSVDSAADDLSSPVSLSRMLTDLELDSPAGLMIFWQPDSSQIMRDYLINATGNESSGGNISQYVANLFGELCQRCSTFRAMAVFLSMADLPDGAGYAFYEYLKNESVGDSGRLVWPEKAINTYALSDHDAVLELWNFSQSHHTMGWLAGSGVSSCVTDHSPLLSGYAQSESREYIRALRAKMDHNGIVLCRFEDTRSFRDIEGLDFTVALDHADGAADATLVFVIGTEDTRAEFTVENVACGQVHSFHCGLSEYPYIDVIDYVGVIVYADSEVTLDIGQISVHSSKLDEEALTSLVTSGAEDAGKKTDYRLALILCAVTIVMSVAAVTAITRHENEEAEALPEESGRRSGIRGGGRT